MPELKRKPFCYEPCTREEAYAGEIDGLDWYLVHLKGTKEISKWSDREDWPTDLIEFVRPVEHAQ